MPIFMFATIMLCLSAGLVSAEVTTVPQRAGDARSLAEGASKRDSHAAAVADCVGMWDRGTHMTKKEWSLTCRRVQNRLERLEIK